MGKNARNITGTAPPYLIEHEGVLNHLVLNCLGLGIVEPFIYLYQKKPTFPEFENWIVQTLGNSPSPEIVAKTNNMVERFLEGNSRDFPLSEKIQNPVLNKEEMEFWEGNGYVTVKNAVSKEDCKEAEKAVWDFLGLDPKMRNSWYRKDQVFWADTFQHPALNKNRSAQRIKKAFAQIWGTEELIASVDRTSFNPPLLDGVDHSGPSKLHWDASIALPIPLDVLGILYLNDVAENQGAFRCIPRFHRKIKTWLSEVPKDVNPRDIDLENLGVVSVGGNAGDLIIWRQDLPHGSGRNHSDIPRIAQYITMTPPDRKINPVWK